MPSCVGVRTATKRALLAPDIESPFDSVFAPPAGLERATGTLTGSSISLIEGTVCFSNRFRRKLRIEKLRQRRPSIYSLTLVALIP